MRDTGCHRGERPGVGGSGARAQGADARLGRWGVDMWHIEIYIL